VVTLILGSLNYRNEVLIKKKKIIEMKFAFKELKMPEIALNFTNCFNYHDKTKYKNSIGGLLSLQIKCYVLNI
jgi:hypothetical protein